MEIIFLRHGRSLADDEKKHEGRYDSPLTDVGREQVQKRAAQLQRDGITFDKVIASPLCRAFETAQIIANTLGNQVEQDEDWMEMDNGDLAGLPLELGRKKFPKPDFQTPYQRTALGTGESQWQLHSRAVRALEKVMQNTSGRHLVVAHGGILNATVRMIIGTQPPVNGSGLVFQFRNTGYLHAEYVPNKHSWIIRRFEPGF